jgi:hypothetical protein
MSVRTARHKLDQETAKLCWFGDYSSSGQAFSVSAVASLTVHLYSNFMRRGVMMAFHETAKAWFAHD